MVRMVRHHLKYARLVALSIAVILAARQGVIAACGAGSQGAASGGGGPAAPPPKPAPVVPQNAAGQNIITVSKANLFTDRNDKVPDDKTILADLASTAPSSLSLGTAVLFSSVFNPPGGGANSQWTLTDLGQNESFGPAITCPGFAPITNQQDPPAGETIVVRSPQGAERNPKGISSDAAVVPYPVENFITDIVTQGQGEKLLYTSFLTKGTKDPVLSCGLVGKNYLIQPTPATVQDADAVLALLRILSSIKPNATNNLAALPLDGSKFLIYADLKEFKNDGNTSHTFEDDASAPGAVTVHMFQARAVDGAP